MRVLVTGAGGMVGSHMVEKLAMDGHDVIGTYYKPTVDIAEINANIKLVECDVRYASSVDNIILTNEPEQIYHLAAQSYPTVSWERPAETIDVNILGTVSIFEAIKKFRKIRPSYDPMVVVACSSAEYGQTMNELSGEEVLIKESAELKPLHPYGVSKVAQDLLAYQYFMNDGIRCIRARIFNSTGTRKVNDVISDFTKRAIQGELSGQYQIRVGNINTRRAIMDQRDLVRALVLLAEKGIPGDVYNISSEKIYQIRDLISIIETSINHKLDLIVDQALMRPTDERVIAGDITKLKNVIGWKQEIPIEQTIKDMLEWWRGKYKLCNKPLEIIECCREKK